MKQLEGGAFVHATLCPRDAGGLNARERWQFQFSL